MEERKAKQSIMMLAEAELGKKSHVDEWKTRNLKRHQKISKAERKIMWKRRDKRETAPKARREELYVKKKKKKTCFTCRFLEDKEFVFHFVP